MYIYWREGDRYRDFLVQLKRSQKEGPQDLIVCVNAVFVYAVLYLGHVAHAEVLKALQNAPIKALEFSVMSIERDRLDGFRRLCDLLRSSLALVTKVNGPIEE
jgi:hypothetical protein